ISVGIVGEDFNAFLFGFAKSSGDAFFVFASGGDGIDTESDPVLDNFVLFGWIGISWTVKEEFDTEFFGGFVRALFAGDKVGVGFALGHEGDGEFFGGGRR